MQLLAQVKTKYGWRHRLVCSLSRQQSDKRELWDWRWVIKPSECWSERQKTVGLLYLPTDNNYYYTQRFTTTWNTFLSMYCISATNKCSHPHVEGGVFFIIVISASLFMLKLFFPWSTSIDSVPYWSYIETFERICHHQLNSLSMHHFVKWRVSISIVMIL